MDHTTTIDHSLFQALRKGNINEVNKCLQCGANVNSSIASHVRYGWDCQVLLSNSLWLHYLGRNGVTLCSQTRFGRNTQYFAGLWCARGCQGCSKPIALTDLNSLTLFSFS